MRWLGCLLGNNMGRLLIPTACVSVSVIWCGVLFPGLQNQVTILNETEEKVTLESICFGMKSEVPNVTLLQDQSILPHRKIVLMVQPRTSGCLSIRCRFDSPVHVIKRSWVGFGWGQSLWIPISRPSVTMRTNNRFDRVDIVLGDNSGGGELSSGWLRELLLTHRNRIGIPASWFD